LCERRTEEQGKGTVIPYRGSALRKMELRLRLFKIFEKEYLAEGYSADEAIAKAFIKVRERTGGADET
jgi:hypothetical protein